MTVTFEPFVLPSCHLVDTGVAILVLAYQMLVLSQHSHWRCHPAPVRSESWAGAGYLLRDSGAVV